MKIEFYSKETGVVVPKTDNWLFVMNNEVYADNGKTFESQAAAICFDDCIWKRPDIGWRIKGA